MLWAGRPADGVELFQELADTTFRAEVGVFAIVHAMVVSQYSMAKSINSSLHLARDLGVGMSPPASPLPRFFQILFLSLRCFYSPQSTTSPSSVSYSALPRPMFGPASSPVAGTSPNQERLHILPLRLISSSAPLPFPSMRK